LKLNQADSLDLARLCCRALEEKKAGDLRVIDVSEPHVRALRVELEKALDSAKTRIIGIETASESGWAVMDAFDVMVHIFTPEKRARYKLEQLWRDGHDVPIKALLAAKKAPSGKKPPAGKKKPAAKRKKSGT
jgi:ribosome-associated protein